MKKSYIYALSAVVLWSSVSTAFKISLRYMSPEILLLISSITAIAVLFAVTVFSKGVSQLKLDIYRIKHSAVNGFLNPFWYYLILLEAYFLLPAQIAQPLNYLWPVMLVLLSAPMLGQKLKFMSIVSALTGFAGVYIIASSGDIFDFKIENPKGVLLASGSSIIWALYWIFTGKDTGAENVKLFWNFIFGTIYIFVYIIFFSEFKPIKPEGWAAAVYVGIFEMGITFYLWLKALQTAERSDHIGNLVFLSPFLALFFISMILHEKIYYTTYIGLLFIISGIFIKQIKIPKQKNR